ncbi:hypothetical protein ACJZ2D_000412 [Fusarium nematophilum]
MDLMWSTGLPAEGNQLLFGLLPYALLTCPLALLLTGSWLLTEDVWASIFWTLFSLRYTRLIIHVLGSWIYGPAQIQPDPRFTRNDVTVIIPTVDPLGPDFIGCFRSILSNCPRKVLVVTVGHQLLEETESVLRGFRDRGFQAQIAVAAIQEPGKRRQVAHAIHQVVTDVIVLADDHVFWPTDDFLPAVLAGFDDGRVGIVATKKRVRRTTPGQWSWASIVNFIACSYLQRHNWELRASNAIDGGVFVVSGRTAAYRTDFLQDADLLERYCNEKFFFGLFGGGKGLGPDDDNFLTREAMKRNLRIRFQDTDDATIETALGEWPKFSGQLVR